MELTRRSLLAGAAAATQLRAAPAAPDWNSLRGQFPLEKGLLYMNAANIAPAPAAIWRAYQQQLAGFQANPSFQNREQYKTLAETVRARIARYLHVGAEEIAILRNTSEGNNLIAQGLKLKPGDEILLTAHNHPSNSDSWKLRAQQAGAAVVTAPVPVNAKTPTDLLDSIAQHLTPRTRVIAVSHFTNVTGLLYPVEQLAQLARQRNAWLHVDGAQSFGWMNLHLHTLAIDSFTSSMHKWPMGPLESGVLYIRRERLEEISPAILSHGYWTDDGKGIRKFELLGQRDDPRLKGMEHTFDFLESLGPAAIEARTRDIAARLRAALATVPGAEVRGSGEPAVSGPVIKVNFPGKDLQKLDAALWARHKLAIAVTAKGDVSGLRFSPHVYNTPAEIDAVVSALRKEAPTA
ncbi:MAG: aminotransferase class V-fold PLP-dependent enzyme [Bryobacteraceae bacterium]|nr:aminotransferase class V-fold PLP-dependent enzyme [Bryobacteraceae bacterium]